MITAGIDCGAKNTKTIILQNGKIIGRAKVLTGFDAVKAVENSLEKAIQDAAIARADIPADMWHRFRKKSRKYG
jgi:benzoyl-CoA reductase subunit D